MVAIFTKPELEAFTMLQLKRLADYYKVSYTKKDTKSDLVEKLVPMLCGPDPQSQEEEIPMSAMVRRIYEQNKEK